MESQKMPEALLESKDFELLSLPIQQRAAINFRVLENNMSSKMAARAAINRAKEQIMRQALNQPNRA